MRYDVMTRNPDPTVQVLDKQILLLRKEGLTCKEIATKLNLTESRCRLAGIRPRRREYLRNYLRKYRKVNPDYYKQLKRKVKENYHRRIRSDHQFRLVRNNKSKIYRKILFGTRKLHTATDIRKVFRDSREIISTKTLVERLGKPTYYHFYSQLQAAIKKGSIERIAWGRYRIIN